MPGPEAEAFVHVADNALGLGTAIDHPHANGQPDALVLLTRRGDSGDGSVPSHPTPVAATYDRFSARWMIENQQITAMQEDATFHVLIAQPDAHVPSLAAAPLAGEPRDREGPVPWGRSAPWHLESLDGLPMTEHAAWNLLATTLRHRDGFETGTTDNWSSTVP